LSRSTGSVSSLVFKYGLALASVVAYALIAGLSDRFESIEGLPPTRQWFFYVVAVIFGALVLGPYAGPRQRAVRFVLLSAASAAIYRLAVWYMAEGPLGFEAATSFAVVGAVSSSLCGLAIVVIAPRPFDWRLLPLTLAAGALGGAAFDIRIPADPYLIVGHAAWQLLTCLALHFGLRETPALAAAA
jgi:hypothetical protein